MTVTSLGKRERTEPEDSSRPLQLAKLGDSSLSQLFTDHADELAHVASFLSARDMRYFPFVNSLCRQVIPRGMQIQLRDKETLSTTEITQLFKLFKPRYDREHQRWEDVNMLRFEEVPRITDQTIFILKMAPRLKFISLQGLGFDPGQYSEYAYKDRALANCLNSKKAFEGIVSDLVLTEAVPPALRPWLQRIRVCGISMTESPRAREIYFDPLSLDSDGAFQRFSEECPFEKLTSFKFGGPYTGNPSPYVRILFKASTHLKDLSLTIPEPFDLSDLNGAPLSLESLDLTFEKNPKTDVPFSLPQVKNFTLTFRNKPIPNPEVLFPFLRRAFPNLRHLHLHLYAAPKELVPFVNSYLLESFTLYYQYFNPKENFINWEQLSSHWGILQYLNLLVNLSENNLRNVLSVCRELKSFTFDPQSRTLTSTRGLLGSVAKSCLKIEELEVFTPTPSIENLLNFVSGLPYLRRLQMTENFSHYSLNVLNQIAKRCPSLQKFKTAVNEYDMKDLGDKALFDTTFLSREADLSDCPLVTYNGLRRISEKASPLRIEHVNLSGCTQFSPRDIHNFVSPILINTDVEDMENDEESPPERSLYTLKDNLKIPRLFVQPRPFKSLNLSRCTQLGLSDLLPIPRYCPSLETLIIKDLGLPEEDLQFLRSAYPNLTIIS